MFNFKNGVDLLFVTNKNDAKFSYFNSLIINLKLLFNKKP